MKALMISTLVVVFAIGPSGAPPVTAEIMTAEEIKDRVDACVGTAMTAHHITGLATAVVVDGEISYETGYGVGHHITGDAVNEHTLFRHGSTGKMFTAAAVLRLVDLGLIDLDDPVTEYIPELHFEGRWTADQIKVRHLINNSAAIPTFRSADDSSLSEWAETLTEVTLFAMPGAFWAYSNSNFALAGLVVERASGMSFPDFVESEIFAPAGMNDSTFDPVAAINTGNYTWGHSDDGAVYSPDSYDYPIEHPSGNGFSSAHDLAVWAQIMLSDSGEVLTPESALTVQQPQMPMHHRLAEKQSIDGGFYGFGLFIDRYPDATITWHNGGAPGWVGRLSWIGSEGFAVALLANSWPAAFAGLNEATECICDAVAGITMPDMSMPSDPATWPAYAGTYDAIFEDGFPFEVVVELEEGRLLITVPNMADPTETITRELENLQGPAFRFWQNAESYWDVTFIPGVGTPAPVRWLRNLRFAGLRRQYPREPTGRADP